MTEKFEEAFAHGILALKTYQLVCFTSVAAVHCVCTVLESCTNWFTHCRDYLPEIHPLTGIQMMKLGKILLFSCRNVEAIRMLLQVSVTVVRDE